MAYILCLEANIRAGGQEIPTQVLILRINCVPCYNGMNGRLTRGAEEDVGLHTRNFARNTFDKQLQTAYIMW
jgi:hypothetical protein